MIKRTTYTDLLQYAYNEKGLCEGDQIQRDIDGDPLVAREYKELIGTLELLNEATPVVSDESIKRILAFC
jgi:hypothetical protein